MRCAERLRVLLVLAASTGGIGRHVATLVEGLTGRGHEVGVCAPAATHAAFGYAALGAQVHAAPVGSAGPRSVARARSLLRGLAGGYDVVHAHGARAGGLCALSRPGLLAVSWHNAPLHRRLARLPHVALEAVAARRADVTLAASADLAERARRAGGRDVRVFPVIAPPLTPRRTPADVRAELVVAGSLVLAVARLHPQKRLDLLVEAVAGRDDGTLVAIAGEGPERGRLERLVARRRAPVRLLGSRDDVADLLAAADVVALTSDWEARPLVAQEALRLGRPLLATDVGGVRELVGEAAVLVPPGDAAAVRSALDRLLADPAARARLAEAGAARSAGWPSTGDMVDGLVDIYLTLKSR